MWLPLLGQCRFIWRAQNKLNSVFKTLFQNRKDTVTEQTLSFQGKCYNMIHCNLMYHNHLIQRFSTAVVTRPTLNLPWQAADPNKKYSFQLVIKTCCSWTLLQYTVSLGGISLHSLFCLLTMRLAIKNKLSSVIFGDPSKMVLQLTVGFWQRLKTLI